MFSSPTRPRRFKTTPEPKKKKETKDQLFNDNHLQKQNSQTTDYNSKFFFSHMASKDTINDLLPLPS
jgi:hypothetical protein